MNSSPSVQPGASSTATASGTSNMPSDTRQSSTVQAQPGVLDSNEFQDLSKWLTDALDNPTSANALLSTQEFFDLSAAASPNGISLPGNQLSSINSLMAMGLSPTHNAQGATPLTANTIRFTGIGSSSQYNHLNNGDGMMSNLSPPPNNSQIRQDYLPFDTLGPASAAFDQFESLEPDASMVDAITQGNGMLNDANQWDVPFASGNDVLGQM
jgi:hypothetical protein